jgi:integrase
MTPTHAPGTVRSVATPGIRKRGNSYEAAVTDPRTRKKIRRTFPTLAAARSWRADALVAVRKGAMKPAKRLTVQQAADALLAGMRDGTIRTRAGGAYRSTTIDQAERSLRLHVLPELARVRVDRLEASELRAFADRMLAAGKDPGTVISAMQPLRLILRRAVLDGKLAVNPSRALGLPGGKRRSDVVTDPARAQRLLGALEPAERVIYATAFYAGLRRGELRALRWRHVNLADGTIRVEESASCHEREPGPVKTDAGRRSVPIIAALRDELVSHRMRTGEPAADVFVFGGRDQPFTPATIRRRAARAWKSAGLEPVALHSARHTFASILIAAGVNAKALTTYVGHASITTTMDVYGHLMRGSEDEAVRLIDAYLARTDTASRLDSIRG